MFMPLITVIFAPLFMSSTTELFTLLPSMSVQTYTAPFSSNDSTSRSTSFETGSLSSRASVTTWTFDTSPSTIERVSRAPSASPPCDARII